MSDEMLPLSVEWHAGELLLLDQTRLPHEVIVEVQTSVEQVWESIRQLKVRGAPAIGIAAAYGLLVDLDPAKYDSTIELLSEVARRADYLNSSRPTAVNLGWALERMQQKVKQAHPNSPEAAVAILRAQAEAIHAEDRAICEHIARAGDALIEDGARILTHCNAGALAVSILGTALAPVYEAHRNGKSVHVFVDETRPLLQGARLTAWELQKSGIRATLICDNMAGHLMSKGEIDLVIVGCDRVAANGDVANKIGTLGVAIMADYFKIPFYVACPSSTIDLRTATGAGIEIEERDADEVRKLYGQLITLPDTPVRNPAFDVTPASLVKGIITEKGILRPPYADKLRIMFGR